MNRRGFFGALVGGIAAVTGIRRLAALPLLRPGDRIRMSAGEATFYDDAGAVISQDRLALVQSAFPGGADMVLQRADEAVALPGTAPWRAPGERRIAMVDACETAVPAADMPEIWPGFSSVIATTASLPPLDQLETLIELFGASGDAAPSFAAALIGELVLTRMRLSGFHALHAPVCPSESIPS